MGLNGRAFLTWLVFAGAACCLGSAPATADDAPPKADAPAAPAEPAKAMKLDQPMAGEMKKEGMTIGEVKKAAGKKEREMKEMMEKEEKAMK